MGKISDDQIRIAKHMRAEGHTWAAIAKATGSSMRGITRRAHNEGWDFKGLATIGQKNLKDGKGGQVNIEAIAELVRDQLATDIQSSVGALAGIKANQLQLSDLEKRERIAESIQKRASNLLNIGTSTDKPVINVAIMSQLPSTIEDMKTVEVADQ